MRIGVVVNRLRTLRSTYATTQLAAAAARADLGVLFIEIGGFTLDPDDRLWARAHMLPQGVHDPEQVVESVPDLPAGLLDVSGLDALLLRNNPVRRTVLDFARAARDRGVTVLNDPDGLAACAGKLTLGTLPPACRPRTVVTADRDVLQAFREQLPGAGVLKPIRGFGGKGVRLLGRDDPLPSREELDRIGGHSGYVVLQEYLRGADAGDKRILLADGEPVGCYLRMRQPGEFRHNLHVGGRPEAAALEESERAICHALAGPLRRDGIFLAGLDVIDGRAVEVNVVAPGGITNIERTTGQPIADRIVRRLRSRLSRSRDGAWTG